MASSLEQNTIKLFITKQKSITKLYIPIYLKMGPGAPLTKTITHTHTHTHTHTKYYIFRVETVNQK